jgi:hypothetical protein
VSTTNERALWTSPSPGASIALQLDAGREDF